MGTYAPERDLMDETRDELEFTGKSLNSHKGDRVGVIDRLLSRFKNGARPAHDHEWVEVARVDWREGGSKKPFPAQPFQDSKDVKRWVEMDGVMCREKETVGYLYYECECGARRKGYMKSYEPVPAGEAWLAGFGDAEMLTLDEVSNG